MTAGIHSTHMRNMTAGIHSTHMRIMTAGIHSTHMRNMTAGIHSTHMKNMTADILNSHEEYREISCRSYRSLNIFKSNLSFYKPGILRLIYVQWANN